MEDENAVGRKEGSVPAGDKEEVPYTSEYLRLHKIGPDYDPDYSAKLEAWLEAELGPLGEYIVVNG